MRGEGKEVFEKTNEGLRVEYGQKAKGYLTYYIIKESIYASKAL